MAQKNTYGENFSAVAEHLVSPYMTSLVGSLRVVDANMECTRHPDGNFHYVYTLRAEIKDDGEPSSTTEKSEKKKKKTKKQTPPIAVSATHLRLPVSFLLYDRKTGEKKVEEAAFPLETTLQEVLRHFYGRMKNAFRRGSLPRMSLLVNGDKASSQPVMGSMGPTSLRELLPPAGGQKLTIVADLTGGF